MSPKVSVFLPSYNKGPYVVDAMRSVLGQTMPDWELWLLENSNDGTTRHYVDSELRRLGPDVRRKIRYELLDGEEIEYRRASSYITSWLLNVYYPEAQGEYVFYLSDDDLLDPQCFEVMAGELDDNPDYFVVYAGLHVAQDAGAGKPHGDHEVTGALPAKDIRSFPGSVDCKIDGGQVMHRKTCLDALKWPYFEETDNADIARHVDGIFLERLVSRFPFWPIDRYLITHRYTDKSAWQRFRGDSHASAQGY